MACECSTPNSLIGPTERIFSKIVVLDYYDGIVTGVARCLGCNSPFLFTVVAWEPSKYKLRVYAVTEISEEEYSGVSHAVETVEKTDEALKTEATESFEATLSRILKRSHSAIILVAADDLDKAILAAREPLSTVAIGDCEQCVSEAKLKELLAHLNIEL